MTCLPTEPTIQEFAKQAQEAGLQHFYTVTDVKDMANLYNFIWSIPGLENFPLRYNLDSLYIFKSEVGAVIASAGQGCIGHHAQLFGFGVMDKIIALIGMI